MAVNLRASGDYWSDVDQLRSNEIRNVPRIIFVN